ncbi:hypothetical protein [Echinicola strongylocentroti]|uniref:hypothetical protein n=1 Tax=Echinicola strongylocentroti TaxID=1795355 RepID=UPI0013A70BC2|nr:hypothetical protein [Echinicola strongylocentroti]
MSKQRKKKDVPTPIPTTQLSSPVCYQNSPEIRAEYKIPTTKKAGKDDDQST